MFCRPYTECLDKCMFKRDIDLFLLLTVSVELNACGLIKDLKFGPRHWACLCG